MMTEQLPPCTVQVSLNEKRHTRILESTVAGLCGELDRVQEERDRLQSAVEKAVADLRAGRNDAALVVLEGTLDAP
jgi:hypothetical protein